MRLPFFRHRDADASGAPAPGARPRRRSGGEAADPAGVEQARTQARRRLVGAAVLLAIGLVTFPLLFETEPRPLPMDTPIVAAQAVPEGQRGSTAPLSDLSSTPSSAPSSAPATATRPLPVLPVQPEEPDTTPPAPEASASAPAAPVRAAAEAAAPERVVAPAVVAPAPVPRTTPPPPVPEAPKPAAGEGRFVVQVGAYAEPDRLRAMRSRLERMGFKTYTQEIETASGKRTRLRIGPFDTRAEAEAVAARLKAAGLQHALLTL